MEATQRLEHSLREVLQSCNTWHRPGEEIWRVLFTLRALQSLSKDHSGYDLSIYHALRSGTTAEMNLMTTDLVAATQSMLRYVDKMKDLIKREAELDRQAEVEQDPDLECPICIQRPHSPETTPCGHVFCSEHLAKWLENHETCPVCRRNVKEDDRRPVAEETSDA